MEGTKLYHAEIGEERREEKVIEGATTGYTTRHIKSEMPRFLIEVVDTQRMADTGRANIIFSSWTKDYLLIFLRVRFENKGRSIREDWFNRQRGERILQREIGAMKSLLLCGIDGVMDYPGLLNIGELSMIDAPRCCCRAGTTLYKKIFIVLGG